MPELEAVWSQSLKRTAARHLHMMTGHSWPRGCAGLLRAPGRELCRCTVRERRFQWGYLTECLKAFPAIWLDRAAFVGPTSLTSFREESGKASQASLPTCLRAPLRDHGICKQMLLSEATFVKKDRVSWPYVVVPQLHGRDVRASTRERGWLPPDGQHATAQPPSAENHAKKLSKPVQHLTGKGSHKGVPVVLVLPGARSKPQAQEIGTWPRDFLLKLRSLFCGTIFYSGCPWPSAVSNWK